MRKLVFMRTIMAVLGFAVLGAGPAAQADDSLAFGRVEAVDVAARRIQAGGMLYALSSTVVIESSNGMRMDLRDILLGATAEMKLAASNGDLPVVTRMVLHPD